MTHRSRHRASTKPRPDSWQRLQACNTWEEVLALPEYNPDRLRYVPPNILAERYKQADDGEETYIPAIGMQEPVVPEITDVSLSEVKNVFAALEKVLTPIEYEVLTRYYVEELSLRGIADLIGRNHTSVRKILNSAEATARAALAHWSV